MSDGTVAADVLRQRIERIERLEEEKKGIGDDIKDEYLLAKAEGYDPKMMRQIVRLRKMQPHDRQEMQAILEVYKAALGMDSAIERTPDMFAAHDGRPDPSKPAPTASSSDDELFMAALHAVVDHQNASTSWLQRQLRIGYNRAARLIELLEAKDVVGPPDHIGKRMVLVPPNGEAHPALALMAVADRLSGEGITMSVSIDGGAYQTIATSAQVGAT